MSDPGIEPAVERALDRKQPITANLPWRARVAIVGLLLVVIILVAQNINSSAAVEKLQKANAAKLEQIERDREKQIGDIAALLEIVAASQDRAEAAGQEPAVTTEQALEALRKSGFDESIIEEAVKRSRNSPGAQGPAGPAGPAGPEGRSAEAPTTTTVPPMTTSTTTTTTTRPPTTTTTRPQPKPCTVGLDVPGLAKVCL